MSTTPEEWLDQVANRLRGEVEGGAAPQPEETTGRELLGHFGHARRGRWVVARIRRALEDRKLHTSPDFEFVWVDAPISISLDDDVGGTAVRAPADPTIRVDMLTAAHNPPAFVKRDDPLTKATTMMRINDFSQLPVMQNERTVKGVVSWKSIGEVYACGDVPEAVRDCMVDAPRIIDIQTPLADATTLVYEHDFVLVQRRDGHVTGILTAADLAFHFRERASPFLLIGEIEHHLRNLVHGKFSVDEFVAAAEGRDDVRGPDDLTFGGYCRLLQPPEAWTKLGLIVDRSVFLSHLEQIRSIRNEVMHFSSDSLDAIGERQLECMARFCRTLVPYLTNER